MPWFFYLRGSKSWSWYLDYVVEHVSIYSRTHVQDVGVLYIDTDTVLMDTLPVVFCFLCDAVSFCFRFPSLMGRAGWDESPSLGMCRVVKHPLDDL